MSSPILKLSGIHAHYGQSHVLHGIDFTIESGSCVALLGRNGMGKTTTIRTIFGQIPLSAGNIYLNGTSISGKPTYELARSGLGLVPEGRDIFNDLTVRENILIAARDRFDQQKFWNLDKILDLFPKLQNRLDNLGNELSGGEQQMLAIGRALVTHPQLLILDEATEGLAPMIRDEIWDVIRQIREHGIATLIVDKDLRTLLHLADRCVILERGLVTYNDIAGPLISSPKTRRQLLGV